MVSITAMLDSFVKNPAPANSPYQRGYLAALLEVDEGSHPRTVELRAQLRDPSAYLSNCGSN